MSNVSSRVKITLDALHEECKGHHGWTMTQKVRHALQSKSKTQGIEAMYVGDMDAIALSIDPDAEVIDVELVPDPVVLRYAVIKSVHKEELLAAIETELARRVMPGLLVTKRGIGLAGNKTPTFTADPEKLVRRLMMDYA